MHWHLVLHWSNLLSWWEISFLWPEPVVFFIHVFKSKETKALDVSLLKQHPHTKLTFSWGLIRHAPKSLKQDCLLGRKMSRYLYSCKVQSGWLNFLLFSLYAIGQIFVDTLNLIVYRVWIYTKKNFSKLFSSDSAFALYF